MVEKSFREFIEILYKEARIIDMVKHRSATMLNSSLGEYPISGDTIAIGRKMQHEFSRSNTKRH